MFVDYEGKTNEMRISRLAVAFTLGEYVCVHAPVGDCESQDKIMWHKGLDNNLIGSWTIKIRYED